MEKKYFLVKQLFITTLLTLLLLNEVVAQQSFNWANSIPYSSPGPNPARSGASKGNDIARDQNGDLITIGFSLGSVDFDPSPTAQALSNGDRSASLYIQKLNENGDYIWHKNYEDNGVVTGVSITTDNDNNIYALGNFGGTINFDASTSITSNGGGDVFLLKLNASGNVLWARNFGLSGYDEANSILFNKNTNELYFTGDYKTVQTPSSVTNDFFLYKLNPVTGADIWVETFGSSKSESSYELAGDSSGNVYVTGTYISKLDHRSFPSTNVISNLLTTPNTSFPGLGFSKNTFVLKLNNGGNVLWAKGINNDKNTRGNVEARAIEIDSNNNVYLVGNFKGIIDFNPNSGQYNVSSQGNSDIFIMSLNNNGAFKWSQRITNDGIGNAIALDNQGGVIIGGSLTNHGFFIGRYSTSNGALGWLHKGSNNNSSVGAMISSLVVSECDNIYATGTLFNGSSDFDPDLNTDFLMSNYGHNTAFNFSWGNTTTNFDTSFTYTVCTNTLKVTGTSQPVGVNPNSDWHLIKYYDPNIPNMTPVTVSSMYWWQQSTPYIYNTDVLTFNYQLTPGCLYYVKHAMYLNNNCAPWQETREYGIQSNLIVCRFAKENQDLTKPKKDINIFQSKEEDLKIFPNPTIESLQIKSISSKIVSYQIFDLSGKNIKSRSKYNSELIDVSMFESGSYIIQITTSEGVYAKQFIKK